MLPSSSGAVVANFFTPSYRVVGKVQVGNSGLIGLLGDPSTSYLKILDASMARLHEPKRLADRFDVIQLVKQGLVVIAAGHREDIGPISVARGGYGRIQRYPIHAIMANFEMEGTLEWAGWFELGVLLTEGQRDFFPLYEATLRAIQFPELELESPALIFNRRKLDIVSRLSDKTDA
ncbi:MAG: hypothetical protein ACE5GO_10810 [Anaerolineales bacterium]